MKAQLVGRRRVSPQVSLAEVLTVIGGQDDEGLVEAALLVEKGKEPPSGLRTLKITS